MKTILLISGVPGVGKSYFGTWLEKEKNFLHLDVEKDGRLEKFTLNQDWLNCFKTSQAEAFVGRLQNLGRLVVLNWGFPTQFLYVVQAMKTAGVQIWWFDADYTIARNVFLKRGDVPVQAFDNQVANIMRDREQIESIFSPNILKTLQNDGNHLAPDKIYDHILMNTTS
ncbi:MAG TPA: hypothetical protein VMW72_05555 [Sedimentisphaerales bacterium]|nr:hypothetical protein [Sedimentisphaerales bacterium]